MVNYRLTIDFQRPLKNDGHDYGLSSIKNASESVGGFAQ